MSSQPFFTIGIPMYNAEKYISRTLDSVLSQSFADFEIIVVNDGSADGCAAIVEEYCKMDSRVKLLNKNNGGVSSARNYAISCAAGRYLYFLDSDDTMWENCLENAYNAITEKNFPDILQTARAKLLKGEMVTTDLADPDYDFAPEGLTKDERAVRIWHEKPMAGSFDIVCTKFINTEFLRRNGIYFSTVYHAQEDNDFIFRMFRAADTVAFANFVTFCYFKYNENSASSSWSARSVASILDRWSSFYFCEAPVMKLSAPYRKMVEDEKIFFLGKVRNGLFKLANQYSREDAALLIDIVERFFEKEIRRLPYKKERFSYMYPFYKVLGIRRTIAIFRVLTSIRDMKK